MNPARGIAYKLISVVLFMTMTALIKATAAEVPPGQAIFIRSLFALPIVIAVLLWQGHLHDGLKVVNWRGHLIRGGVGAVAMALIFFSLAHIPLPEVVAIFFAVPILVTLLAALMLGERLRLYRMTAIAIGLVGVLIILSPRLAAAEQPASDIQTLAAIGVFVAAVLAAFAHVYVRKLTATDTIASISFYFAPLTTILSLLSIPFGWVWPTLEAFLMLTAAGLVAGAAQIFLTASYSHAEAAVVAPFDYAQIVFALIIGYFIFDELPTAIMLFGAAITISAGLVIIWRERQLGIAKKQVNLKS